MGEKCIFWKVWKPALILVNKPTIVYLYLFKEERIIDFDNILFQK